MSPAEKTRRTPAAVQPGPEVECESGTKYTPGEYDRLGLPAMRPASIPLEAPDVLASIVIEIAGPRYAMALAAELILASEPVTR